ncbi:hypothetical protein DPMN_111694 [Dreissena polymorpha]|uniref:Ig-like domain-containing protein n=1 Tax=Dreissena polymorpha TaxID=45954 RepID=A0A9D4KFP1_DREPO|nr:hypothetical protein DPMN_111694 [Dreissena polymorpha]
MEIKRMLVKLLDFKRTWMLFLLIFLRHSDAHDYYRNNPSSIPRFLPVPTNITVHEGETAHLRCRIHNLSPKFVVWRKADEESPLTLGKMTFTPDKDIEVQLKKSTRRM